MKSAFANRIIPIDRVRTLIQQFYPLWGEVDEVYTQLTSKHEDRSDTYFVLNQRLRQAAQKIYVADMALYNYLEYIQDIYGEDQDKKEQVEQVKKMYMECFGDSKIKFVKDLMDQTSNALFALFQPHYSPVIHGITNKQPKDSHERVAILAEWFLSAMSTRHFMHNHQVLVKVWAQAILKKQDTSRILIPLSFLEAGGKIKDLLHLGTLRCCCIVMPHLVNDFRCLLTETFTSVIMEDHQQKTINPIRHGHHSSANQSRIKKCNSFAHEVRMMELTSQVFRTGILPIFPEFVGAFHLSHQQVCKDLGTDEMHFPIPEKYHLANNVSDQDFRWGFAVSESFDLYLDHWDRLPGAIMRRFASSKLLLNKTQTQEMSSKSDMQSVENALGWKQGTVAVSFLLQLLAGMYWMQKVTGFVHGNIDPAVIAIRQLAFLPNEEGMVEWNGMPLLADHPLQVTFLDPHTTFEAITRNQDQIEMTNVTTKNSYSLPNVGFMPVITDFANSSASMMDTKHMLKIYLPHTAHTDRLPNFKQGVKDVMNILKLFKSFNLPEETLFVLNTTLEWFQEKHWKNLPDLPPHILRLVRKIMNRTKQQGAFEFTEFVFLQLYNAFHSVKTSEAEPQKSQM